MNKDSKNNRDLDNFFSDELKNKSGSQRQSFNNSEKEENLNIEDSSNESISNKDEKFGGRQKDYFFNDGTNTNFNEKSNRIGNEQRNKEQIYNDYSEESANKYNGDESRGKPQPKPVRSIVVLIFSLLILLSFVFGIVVAEFFAREQEGVFKYYQEACEFLEQEYLYGFDADNALGQALDGYTYIIDPYEYYSTYLTTDLPIKIFGVSYDRNDDLDNGLDVMSVSLNSPLDLAGLRVGDRIVVLNDKYLKNMTMEWVVDTLANNDVITIQVERKLRNSNEIKLLNLGEVEKDYVESSFLEYFFIDEEGNAVTNFKVRSNAIVNQGEEVDFQDYVHYDAYCLDKLDIENVGYIKLHQFWYTEEEMQADSVIEFGRAMELFKNAYQGEGKLVLDLVDNGGGLNTYCTTVAGYFIYDDTPNQTLEVSRLVNKHNAASSMTVESVYHEYFDENDEEKDIVVLTNEYSASASEMLVGAMLVYDTAIQVGKSTYGKGVSQRVASLENVYINVNGKRIESCYALKYTFAFFYTPNLADRAEYKYNNYCNHIDKDGNGYISQEEVNLGSFRPDEENIKTNIYDMIVRANEILRGA